MKRELNARAQKFKKGDRVPVKKMKDKKLKGNVNLVEEIAEEVAMVGQCKLDPGLRATCFQPLNLRVRTVLST